MKDRFISNKSDRRLGSRAGSFLGPQLCFLSVTHRLRQCDLNLSLPMALFFDITRKSARSFVQEPFVTLTNFSALSSVCSDAWSSETEASVIRKAMMTPAHQVSDLEAWYREREMLIEVNDDDYQEPRLSAIG